MTTLYIHEVIEHLQVMQRQHGNKLRTNVTDTGLEDLIAKVTVHDPVTDEKIRELEAEVDGLKAENAEMQASAIQE
jgi:hypothetical protein